MPAEQIAVVMSGSGLPVGVGEPGYGQTAQQYVPVGSLTAVAAALATARAAIDELTAHVIEVEAERDRYREAAHALARIATGEVGHDFMGRCPSEPDDDIRDPGCPACRLLSEWDETRDALAPEEGSTHAG